MASGALIDWSWPWLEALRPGWGGIVAPQDVAKQLGRRIIPARTHTGHPVQFVPQAELPPGVAYEAYISATGRVPTRDNLHDLFNGIMWLRYPKIKAALNARQAEQIALGLRPGHRGPTRDAATLFDENALLLVTQAEAIVEALRSHAWREVFCVARTAWHAQVSPRLFGHALMEKLMQPYPAITAHVWHVPLPASATDEAVDACVAQQLVRGPLEPCCFSPMPVLGVPGWWEANADFAFYDDVHVFRPARNSRSGARPGAQCACT